MCPYYDHPPIHSHYIYRYISLPVSNRNTITFTSNPLNPNHIQIHNPHTSFIYSFIFLHFKPNHTDHTESTYTVTNTYTYSRSSTPEATTALLPPNASHTPSLRVGGFELRYDTVYDDNAHQYHTIIFVTMHIVIS